MLGSRKWFFILAALGMFSVLLNSLMPYFATGGHPDWTVVTSTNQFFKEVVAAIIGGLLALERSGEPVSAQVTPPPTITVTTLPPPATTTVAGPTDD